MDAHLDDPQTARERRGGLRRALRLEAGAARGGEAVNAVVLNLSDSGLLLETEAPLKPGEALDVVLPEAGTRTARVVWAGHGLAGCKFDAPRGKSALSAAALASAPVNETMGQRLRRLREDQELSMVRLAQRLGVSKQTLWNWETDRTLPQPRFLAALAEALLVPEGELGAARENDPSLKAPEDPDASRDAAIAHHKARIAELLGVEPEQVEIVVRY